MKILCNSFDKFNDGYINRINFNTLTANNKIVFS